MIFKKKKKKELTKTSMELFRELKGSNIGIVVFADKLFARGVYCRGYATLVEQRERIKVRLWEEK